MGAVLAGGESRRFGESKAEATLDGRRLVDRAADTLSTVCEDVIVVSSRPVPTSREVVPDLRPSSGPLAGLEAALSAAGARSRPGVVVLACDLPLVRSTTLAWLGEALDEHEAAVTTCESSGPQPLCGAYRLSSLTTVTALLDEGVRTVRSLLDHLDATTLLVPNEELLNVNTPEDMGRVEAVLRARRRVRRT